MNMNKNFSEYLDMLDKRYGGAAFTFCTRRQMALLISLAKREGKLHMLPSRWTELEVTP
jgi:hypothetical protein